MWEGRLNVSLDIHVLQICLSCTLSQKITNLVVCFTKTRACTVKIKEWDKERGYPSLETGKDNLCGQRKFYRGGPGWCGSVDWVLDCPGWCGSVDWVPDCEAKARRFDSQSCLGCGPGPQWGARKRQRGNHALMFLSLSFSSLPFSLKINKILKRKKESSTEKEKCIIWLTYDSH